MRTVARVIGVFAAVLIVGGGLYVWLKSRPLGAPTAEQWDRLEHYQTSIAIADGMGCMPDMMRGTMRLEEAKEKLSRLKDRYTLSPKQVADLDTLANTGRSVAIGTENPVSCNATRELVDQMIGQMDGE